MSTETKDQDSGSAWSLGDRLHSYVDDLVIVGLAALALLTLMSLFGWTSGSLATPLGEVLWSWLGWLAALVPLLLAAAALFLALRAAGRPLTVRWNRVIAAELAIMSALGLLGVLSGPSVASSEAGAWGGLVGWGIATLISDVVGRIGAGLVLLSSASLFGMYSLQGLLRQRGTLDRWMEQLEEVKQGGDPSASTNRPSLGAAVSGAASRIRRGRVPAEFQKNFEVPELEDGVSGLPVQRDDSLPSLELLEQTGFARVTAKEINRAAGLIEKTLADFGLPARVVDFRSGPTVTQFAVEPGYVEQVGSDGAVKRSKIRVSQISALANDLALALSAPRLRIEAPVPGQAYIGIEVPNRHGALVRLRPMLESEPFLSVESPLAVALGRDVAGSPVAADLAAMPHLLIAGTTGSGKSVCITSLATCLVMNNSPEDLRLVMVDPKMVELARFNGLPHLFGQVETELERIIGVLRWCTMEMDRRYRMLEEARARDIDAYNRRARRAGERQRLPRVVVLIDELADLMMLAPDQTERTLVRLAQMARAVGMHLVVATQRPSTEIVTGLIKANFPARISFATASNTDSRVVLDMPGAETLLGRGDLLYLAAEAAAPIRLQGVFVSDQEVERILAYWRRAAEDAADEAEAPWESLLQRQEAMEELDDIIEQAIHLVKQEGEASASLLQRRLRIGYPRAARLMDELEELGVIGEPQAGGKTREVLIDPHQDPLLPGHSDEDDA